MTKTKIASSGAAVLLVALLVTPASSSVASTTARCSGRVATIVGTNRGERLRGTPGPDVIVGGRGSDTILGRGGKDVICGNGGNDSISGGRRSDEISGGRGIDTLYGGGGRDHLRGNSGNDSEFGESGPDTFLAGHDGDDDSFDGGDGRDLLDMSYTDPCLCEEPTGHGPAHVDLAAGTATEAEVGTDQIVLGTIENVYGTGLGDTLIGDEDDNVLNAGFGDAVRLEGGGGDDILTGGEEGSGGRYDGGAGADFFNVIDGSHTFDGGEGIDGVGFCGPYGGTRQPLTIDLAAGTATSEDGGLDMKLRAIENAEGCDGNDRLVGDAGPNVLRALGGDDSIAGGAGDDQLDGGAGTDSLDGGEGNDACAAGEANTACES